MTISTENQKVNKAKFDVSFDAIFGVKPTKGGSFVQTADGLVPRSEVPPTRRVNAPSVHGGIEPFKSPIDGTVISDRAQLARHHKAHGTTDSRDYSDGYIERQASKRNAEGEHRLKSTRRSDINAAIMTHTR